MAEKKFNAVAGFSVGSPGNVIDVVDNVANVYANRIFVTQYSNLGDVANVYIGGGTTNQVLKTNGSGTLTWALDTASAGGNTTEVQFNENGSLAGSSAFSFDNANTLLTIAGNIVTNNASLGNLATSNFFSGNGSLLTSITGANITGTVSAAINATNVTAADQPNITSLGTMASTTFASNANITLSGTLSQITGANLVSATYISGTLTTSEQPNITSLGTLASLNVSANVTSGNASLGNLVTANYFSGNGSLLTGTVANANYAAYAGNITIAAQPNITSVGTLADVSITGLTTATGGVKTPNIVDVSGTTTIITKYNNNTGDVGIAANLTVGSGGTGNLKVNGVSDLGPVGNVKITGGFNNAVLTTDGAGALSWASPNYANYAGTVTSAAQPNITSLGTLSSLTSGDTTINGNLTVNGTTSNLSVTNLSVQDNMIDISAETVGTPSQNAGFRVIRGDDPSLQFRWNESAANWQYTIDGFSYLNLVGKNTDGNINVGNITAISLSSNSITANYLTGTLTTAAQPNITSVGTLVNTTLGSANSLTGGNLVSATYLTGTLTTAAQPNVTSVGTLVDTTMGSSNSLTGGNLVSATYITGTLTTAVQPNVTSLGTLASLNVTATITSGNANLGNLAIANYITGTLTTAVQPNITSVGTLADANIQGNVYIGGNLIVNGATEYTNVNNLYIKDPIIEMGGNANAGALTTNDGKDRGTLLHYYTTTPVDAFMGWDNSNAEFGFGSNVSVSSEVVTWNQYGNVRANYYLGSADFLSGTISQSNYAAYAGNVTISAQPNITSVGTLVNTTMGSSNSLSGGNLVSATYLTGTLTTKIQPNITSVGTLVDTTMGSGNSLTGGNLLSATYITGTLTTAIQSNITSLGTLASLTVTGLTTATGGVKTANIIDTAGTVTIQTKYNTNSGDIGVTGNIVAGAGGTGNVTATYFVGNGAALTYITGGNVTGQVANSLIAGTVYTNAQPNITSLGTLNNLTANGTINLSGASNVTLGSNSAVHISGGSSGQVLKTDGSGNLYWGLDSALPGGTNSQVQFNDNGSFSGVPGLTFDKYSNTLSIVGNIDTGSGASGNISGANYIIANYFVGDGSFLTNVAAATNYSNANVAAFLPTYTGNVSAAFFIGDGSLLTGLPASYSNTNVASYLPTYTGTLTAGNITATGNITSGNAALGNLASATYFSGNGSLLTYLNASNIGSGTIPSGILGNSTTYVGTTAIALNRSSGSQSLTGVSIDGSANYATYAGTVTTNAQPNITSVGTLTSVVVSTTANVGTLNATDGAFSGNVVVSGNLSVQGNTNYINVDSLTVEDPIIELGGGPNNAPLTTNDGKDRGTLLHYYTTAPVNAFMGWDNSNGEFAFGSNVSVSSELVTFNSFGNVRASYFLGNASLLSGINASNLTSGTISSSILGNSTVYVGTTSIALNRTSGSQSLTGVNIDGTANYATFAGTVTTNAQPNITSVGTLASVSVTANVTAGNVLTNNLLYANGVAWNFGSTYSNANVAAYLPTYAGNFTAGNISATSNVTAAYFVGNGSQLTGLPASYSNTNVAAYLPTYTGNVSASYFIGNGATLTFITGANVDGQVSNALVSGTVYTNAQPNITSVGTLSTLIVSGNANVDGVLYANTIVGPSSANVTITAGTFVSEFDDTGNITLSDNVNVVNNLSAANVLTDHLLYANGVAWDLGGTYGNSNVANYLPTYTGEFTAGNVNVTGNVTSAYFIGNGSQLTGLPASYANSNVAAYLPTYTGNVSANYFIGNGATLTFITGANVDGQVGNALVAGTVYTNAQPNITSVGILSSVDVTGNASAGNVLTDHLLYANGAPYVFTTTAAGSNTQIQFNDNTAFAGNANLTFNKTTNTVTTDNIDLNGNITVNGLTDLGSVANITISGGTSGYVLTTDGSGSLTWGSAGSGAAGLVSISKDRFLTTGSANTFSLSTTPASQNLIEVIIDGLQQISNTYSLSGTTLSFPTNPVAGQIIEVTTFGAVDLTGNIGEVQYNAGGSFGSSNTFTFNSGTNTLAISHLVASGNLTSQAGYVYVNNGIIAVDSGNAGIFNTGVANINLGLAANVTIGSTTGNTTIRGNLLANNASLTNLSVNNYYSGRDAVTVATDTIIDQFPVNAYRSAKYTMRINSDDGYQAVEVLLVHNGSSSYVTIYGSISSSGSDIITMSSNIGSGNVRLFASTASTNTNVKVLGTYVPD